STSIVSPFTVMVAQSSTDSPTLPFLSGGHQLGVGDGVSGDECHQPILGRAARDRSRGPARQGAPAPSGEPSGLAARIGDHSQTWARIQRTKTRKRPKACVPDFSSNL